MATYAVADIHGQLKTFLAGLKEIGFSSDDRLYVLGDAIDRGPAGMKLLQMIMQKPNMDLIIGNHEFMMLNSVDPGGEKFCNGEDAALWLYYNGGDETYKRYKITGKAKRVALLDWLRSRCVIKTIELEGRKICLSHSYYKEGLENTEYKDMSYRDVWNIVWTSIYRDDPETKGTFIYDDYDYTFITGHVPVQRIRKFIEHEEDFGCLKAFTKGNLIDIDGGCAFGRIDEVSNGLIFLRLEDMKEFPVPFAG